MFNLEVSMFNLSIRVPYLPGASLVSQEDITTRPCALNFDSTANITVYNEIKR